MYTICSWNYKRKQSGERREKVPQNEKYAESSRGKTDRLVIFSFTIFFYRTFKMGPTVTQYY